jgi:type IV pilus assembly protein PilM
MSIFTDILNRAKTILPLGGGSGSGTVGIDIGSSSIKVVQVEKRGGVIHLETYGELSLGTSMGKSAGELVALSTDDAKKAILDTLKQSTVTAQISYMGLKSQSALLFVLELPEVKDSELALVVSNESRKYIPVPLSEVSLDWFVIPAKTTYDEERSGTRQKLEVLVVAVRNDSFSEYKQVAEGISPKVSGFEVEAFPLLRATLGRDITPVVVVDAGASATRVFLAEFGIVRASHTIDRGGFAMTDSIVKTLGMSFERAEAAKKELGLHGQGDDLRISSTLETHVNFIVSELHRLVSDFERSLGKPVGRVILSGGVSLMPGFVDVCAKELGIPVQITDAFSKTEAPEFLGQVLQTASPTFSIALGLALKDVL